jgi:hypothetical protein
MGRIFNDTKKFFITPNRANSGGFVTFYESGTVVEQNTYSDKALTTPNTNPLVLDSDGRFQVDVYGDVDPYTMLVQDVNLVQIESVDNISILPGYQDEQKYVAVKDVFVADSTIPSMVISAPLTVNDTSSFIARLTSREIKSDQRIVGGTFGGSNDSLKLQGGEGGGALITLIDETSATAANYWQIARQASVSPAFTALDIIDWDDSEEILALGGNAQFHGNPLGAKLNLHGANATNANDVSLTRPNGA